ncbi:MAG: DegV family protein, partial [Lachnospiraceae bacterium]|nr:DegV family protein [Lachnospiraceae bacterium]
RVSKIIASAVGIMNIRILGTASKEGTIEPVGKCRGEKKLIETVLQEIKKIGYKGGKIRICHVENEELAKAIIEGLKRDFGKIDIKSILAGGLCSFYAEKGGIIIGCECS